MRPWTLPRPSAMDEACQRFEELYLDTKESVALTFNVAFCNEMRGDLLRANQGYKRASELVNAPESQIDRRLAVTEKALRENPVAFMPTARIRPRYRARPRPCGGGRPARGAGDWQRQLPACRTHQPGERCAPGLVDRLSRIGFDVTTLEDLNAARFESVHRANSPARQGRRRRPVLLRRPCPAGGWGKLPDADRQRQDAPMEDVRDGGGVQLASIMAKLDVASPVVKLVVIDACVTIRCLPPAEAWVVAVWPPSPRHRKAG